MKRWNGSSSCATEYVSCVSRWNASRCRRKSARNSSSVTDSTSILRKVDHEVLGDANHRFTRWDHLELSQDRRVALGVTLNQIIVSVLIQMRRSVVACVPAK